MQSNIPVLLQKYFKYLLSINQSPYRLMGYYNIASSLLFNCHFISLLASIFLSCALSISLYQIFIIIILFFCRLSMMARSLYISILLLSYSILFFWSSIIMKEKIFKNTYFIQQCLKCKRVVILGQKFVTSVRKVCQTLWFDTEYDDVNF